MLSLSNNKAFHFHWENRIFLIDKKETLAFNKEIIIIIISVNIFIINHF